MLPFCGYHMGDYFKHWLDVGRRRTERISPRFFYVNWFRKTSDGNWLWPGYGENSRVLKWICERIDGTARAVETPIGYVPAPGAIDRTGLNVSDQDMAELLRVDVNAWLQEVESIKKHYSQFGDSCLKVSEMN